MNRFVKLKYSDVYSIPSIAINTSTPVEIYPVENFPETSLGHIKNPGLSPGGGYSLIMEYGDVPPFRVAF